ncbi:MAG: NAD(P)H-dependent oxidoreductase [Selenomonadaceae bacterium]|nr:NAD(P)H-dependent oxidoreductase [Selenomonadaceae bacterium]
MSKKLVAFFSASGSTRKLSQTMADAIGADLYEIKPSVKYTGRDLNWNDQNARSTVEMRDPKSRPELADTSADVAGHDVIYIGFPIWWYVAPHIINSFLEAYDFSGKTIVLYATSGGSGFGNTLEELKPSAPAVGKWIVGKVFRSRTSADELKAWDASLNI